MNQVEQLEQLRELFLTAPESDAVRILAISFSLALVVIVLWMVRRRILRAEYTPIWMIVAFSLLLVSFRLDLLHAITRALGAWTTSSTVFFLGEFFLFLNQFILLFRTPAFFVISGFFCALTL